VARASAATGPVAGWRGSPGRRRTLRRPRTIGRAKSFRREPRRRHAATTAFIHASDHTPGTAGGSGERHGRRRQWWRCAKFSESGTAAPEAQSRRWRRRPCRRDCLSADARLKR
jgi:hypothetical protein